MALGGVESAEERAAWISAIQAEFEVEPVPLPECLTPNPTVLDVDLPLWLTEEIPEKTLSRPHESVRPEFVGGSAEIPCIPVAPNGGSLPFDDIVTT